MEPSTNPPPQKVATPSVWNIYFPSPYADHHQAIYLASFPQIIYFWPTIILFYLNAFLQGVAGVSPVVLGWVTVIVATLNLMVLVQDFDQKRFIILMLTLTTVVLGSWIISLYGFTFLKSLVGWFFAFQPSMSTDGYLLCALLLSILLVWGLITPLFSYWRFEQNEFVHFSRPVGKDMSIARTGCTVYKEIPDVFECALGFGAGSLVIRKDNQILATIPHVPFLGLRMKGIEHMLSETRVVVERE